MITDTPQRRDHRFLIGILAGSFLGVGLMLWLAPAAMSELRRRAARPVRDLGQRAGDSIRRTAATINDTADDLVTMGQDVRDNIAGAVARGAHEVERVATAAKSDRRA